MHVSFHAQYLLPFEVHIFKKHIHFSISGATWIIASLSNFSGVIKMAVIETTPYMVGNLFVIVSLFTFLLEVRACDCVVCLHKEYLDFIGIFLKKLKYE